ncbi:efflux RND transporter periplasmic adaptor subunit [Pseudomonas fluorescens]|uniref:efflux RND transporter periplasmic adaptor subunit n=1 Tax=Pseudomonas fluorescens TaxID=294 RepID=UPI0017860E2A|nr:efflux RND transporter periplasmic adaptor subunit [Pseudomonas fluorescens]MBD8236062.1 efflux RND transporter periplasmic adaptor subunit [Pseudomonas fluorescens]MDY0894714.1 efflux RND transporter periplasmic adaptor subunit [Pseudomonas fluorescens]
MHGFPQLFRPWARLLILGLACLTTAACSRESPVPEPAVRSVKVTAVRAAQVDAAPLTGVVRQRQRATLAFEGAGRLVALNVDVGDSVKQGQVLASLDTAAVRLRLKQAQATLFASVAQTSERKRNKVRQQQLFTQGSVATSAVEQAEAAWQAAVAQQTADEAALDLVRCDQRQGQLIAPFNGRVVARPAQLYSELSPGQVVMELEASGALQVLVQIPVEQAASLKPGDHAIAADPTAPGSSLPLVLEGLSMRAQNGLLQSARFRLSANDLALPSGVNLNVRLASPAPLPLSIPTQALRIGGDASQVQVFVYDPTAGKVAQRDIKIGLIDQGRVTVDNGLKDGEQVVVTGVAFLSDGQPVNLLAPSSRLSTTE